MSQSLQDEMCIEVVVLQFKCGLVNLEISSVIQSYISLLLMSVQSAAASGHKCSRSEEGEDVQAGRSRSVRGSWHHR